MAGKVNDKGAIYISPNIPYKNKELALVLNRTRKTVELALEVLLKFEIICIEEDIIYIINWGKHQYVEGMERVRELGKARKQRERSLKNKPSETLTSSIEKDMSRDMSRDVTQQNKNRKDIDAIAKDVYEYYMSLWPFSHGVLTARMTKAIAKANETLDVEELKTLLERHKNVVEMTKGNEKPVKPRMLDEFFDGKSYEKETLIYEEYLEGGEKYERYLRNSEISSQARIGYLDCSKPITPMEE
jgi:predicted phage replisome organizer